MLYELLQKEKMVETKLITQRAHGIVDTCIEHRNKFFIAAVALAISCVAFFGYRYYQHRVQIAAHQEFMTAMKQFDKPVKAGAKSQDSFASDEEKWRSVEETFRNGYKNHKSSTLAPMFLAFQATSLVAMNRLNDAISVMKSAVHAMTSPMLKSYYEITLSLMQLDSSNKSDQEDGVKRLQLIALDKKHIAQSQALYHLGLFAWTHKNFNEAKNYWQQFMPMFGGLAGFEHQTAVIKEKLDLIEA